MRILKVSVSVLFIVLLAGTATMLFAPSAVVRPIVSYYLNAAGFELVEFGDLSLHGDRAGLERLVLANDAFSVAASAIELSYTLTELLGGELRAIAIGQLQVDLLPALATSDANAAADASANSPPLSARISNAMQMLQNLPLANLRIDAMDLRSADSSLDVVLQVDTQPLRIAGTIASSDYAGIRLQISVSSDDDAITGELSLLQDAADTSSRTMVQASFSANVAADKLQWQSHADLDLTALQSLIDPASTLANFIPHTESVSIDLQLTADNLAVAPALSAVTVTLDSPDHLFRIAQQSSGRANELQVQLPARWSGSMASLEQALHMHSESVAANFTSADSTLELGGELMLNSPRVSCTLPWDCSGTTDLTTRIYTLQEASPAGGALAALDAQLQGKIDFTYASAGMGVDLNLTTEIANLNFPGAVLHDPSITGNISYADDTLLGTFNLALANQLQATVTASFQPAAQTGTVNWEIPTYYFSDITPLSGLLTLTDIDADLVTGSIGGSGNLTVTAGTDGTWQVDGPLNLQLSELSGFVADSFFVGLNTTVEATVSDNGTIQTQHLLGGSIATLDVGLPLTDLRWNYRFNSAAQRIAVSNLLINTLGGEITMADFDYDIQNPDSSMTVVLTNLNLQSIVDLAQYLGIRVEGLISGYLPLTLRGQTLTVTEGLVGALQPGGTIRYTSGNPVSSGNATLDLVNAALANYHYQIMNTVVYYNEAGDLRLEVQLQGNNPDLYNGQVVNLNVNIDDNIPSLLRSLQASRTITDALEQHLQNRRRNQ